MVHNRSRKARTNLYGLSFGDPSSVVVDSDMSYQEAVLQGLRKDCPVAILEAQVLLEVYYHGFDGKIHRGQIVVNQAVADEVEEVFAEAFHAQFPVTSVIPISKFSWDDNASMDANNTSGFNYRPIAGEIEMSPHATGIAIDINPRLNPHYKADGSIVPPGGVYEPGKLGVLVDGDSIVSKFTAFGWGWGGHWRKQGRWGIDWQHFDKLVPGH